MYPQALPSGAEQIAVTDVATTLLELIRTAASNSGFEFDPVVNYCVLQVDSASPDGGIRYAASSTPTASKGIEVTVLNAAEIPLNPADFKLIRTGGSNALVNVEVWRRRTTD